MLEGCGIEHRVEGGASIFILRGSILADRLCRILFGRSVNQAQATQKLSRHGLAVSAHDRTTNAHALITRL